MRAFGRSSRIVLGLVLVAAIGFGLLAASTEAQARKGSPCICPKIYAPVVCKGGKVFSNQCVADCRNAKDCVPLGL